MMSPMFTMPSAESVHDTPERTRSVTALEIIVVVGLVALPIIIKLFSYASYPGSDDAFIHMAVARHILEQQVWGIDSSNRVNLSSSPLFTVTLLPILSIGSIGLAQAFSLGCTASGLALTYVVTRRFASPAVALIALAIAAANVHLWRWSGTVMEATFAFLLVVAIAGLCLTIQNNIAAGRWQLMTFGALVGLGTLTRFEVGIFLILGVFTIVLAWRARLLEVCFFTASGFLAALTPWIVFGYAYFGTPIPTTFSAKASSFHLFNATIIKQLGPVFISGFTFSVLVAAVTLLILLRSNVGRQSLRGMAPRLVLLVGWPVAMFGFYYLKTDGLQSAARYFLPGMATWPIVVALLLSALPVESLRAGRHVLGMAVAGCLAAGLVINAVQVRPVLISFNDAYRATMVEGAAYLREQCRPGDIALVYVDIGVMADEGIGNCTLVDGGALATPEMRGQTLQQMLVTSNPTYIVESIGSSSGHLLSTFPELRLDLSRQYISHGVSTAGQSNYLNIYAVIR